MAIAAPFMVQLGTALAVSAVSAVISYLLTPAPPDQEGPRLDDLSTTTSAYGKFRTIAYGKVANTGNVIDSSDMRETAHDEEVGGKGGKSSTYTSYTSSQDIALGLGEPIGGVLQIYANGYLIYDINGDVPKKPWLSLKIYLGTEDQEADPTLQAMHGVDDTPAYRGEAYIVFTDFQLADYGNRTPLFQVITVSTAQDANSELNVVVGHDTVNDATITSMVRHPVNGDLFYALKPIDKSPADWNKNVLISVISPYDDNSPKYGAGSALINDDAYYASAHNLGFGNISEGWTPYNYFFLLQVERTSPGNYLKDLAFNLFDVNTGRMIYSGILLNSKETIAANTKPIPMDGPGYKDRGVYLGVHSTDFINSFIRTWNIYGSGDISPTDDKPFIPRSGWRAENIFVKAKGTDGDFLIHGNDSDLPNGEEGIITKYSFESGIQWVITVPSSFYVGDTSLPLSFAVYDEIEKVWWSVYGGKIWCFDDAFEHESAAGGATYHIWDLTSDPEYLGMEGWPALHDGVLYWHAEWTNPETSNLEFTIQAWSTEGFRETNQALVDHELRYYPMTTVLGDQNWDLRHSEFSPEVNAFYGSDNSLGTYAARKYKLGGLIADEGITLAEILADICDRCGMEAIDYDVTDTASTIVNGYHIAKLMAGRSNIGPLQHGYLFDAVDTAGTVKFVMKGNDSIATLERDDLAASLSGSSTVPMVKSQRIMEHQLPAQATVIYINPDSRFEPGTQKAERVASNNTNSIKIELPILFKDNVAKELIDKILHLTHIERESYEIQAMPKWQHLEAADVIEIPGLNEYFTVRIVKTSFEQGIKKIEAVREEKDAYTSYVVGDPSPPKDDIIKIPGVMLYVLLDIPLLRDSDDNAGMYAVASSYTETWDGGVLYKSLDGSSWGTASTFTSRSTYGTLIEALPIRTPLYWDFENTINIQMIAGDFSGTSKSATLQGFNSIAVGSGDLFGEWEIINYQEASEISPGVYELSKLIRGRLGSESVASGAWRAGSYVIPLNESNLKYFNAALSELDDPVDIKGVTFGVNVNDPANTQSWLINQGICLKPLAPAQIKGVKQGNLDLEVTWMPRSRYPSKDFFSGRASETDDIYYIWFLNSADEIKRTVQNHSGKSYTYLRADQIADFSGVPQDIKIIVWHTSQRVGTGYEGRGVALIGTPGKVAYLEAVGNVGPYVHFAVDEDYASPSGQAAVDRVGTITDATYNSNSVQFLSSGVPSNIAADVDDKWIFATSAIGITTNSNLFNIGDSFSLSFAMKVDPSKTTSSLITRTDHFRVRIFNGAIQISVWGPGGEQKLYRDGALELRDNVLRSFVVTVEITPTVNNLHLYIDGIDVSSVVGDTITSIAQPTSVEFSIDANYLSIDNFAFYNKILSAADASYLHDNISA